MGNNSEEPIRKAVILAGGLGARLRPITNIIPKPLLPIGHSTVLEIQILGLKKHGVKEIFLATNYMTDYVKSVIGTGDKYGLNVTISQEKEPLGTCGPITLLKDDLTDPFFLMNGDILTDLNFSELGSFAQSRDANLTVVTKEISIPFRFGKVTTDGDFIVSIEEKPTYKQEILAGIYVLKPDIFDKVPENTRFGIDELIINMLHDSDNVAKFLTHDYWIDIGQMEDYEVAKKDADENRINIHNS